jgi:hypothetical protein
MDERSVVAQTFEFFFTTFPGWFIWAAGCLFLAYSLPLSEKWRGGAYIAGLTFVLWGPPLFRLLELGIHALGWALGWILGLCVAMGTVGGVILFGLWGIVWLGVVEPVLPDAEGPVGTVIGILSLVLMFPPFAMKLMPYGWSVGKEVFGAIWGAFRTGLDGGANRWPME